MSFGWRSVCMCVCFTLAFVEIEADSIGLDCKTSEDCDTRGADCVNGVCSCPAGKVMTADMSACLQGATEWGSACEDDVQCVSRLLVGGNCDESTRTCQCATGFHYLRGRCWRSAGLGAECSRDERCYANHDSESIVCKEKKCQCADGFYQREYSSCRRIANTTGEGCGIPQDCHFPGAICVERLCACPDDSEFDSAKGCVRKVSSTTLAPTTPVSSSSSGGAVSSQASTQSTPTSTKGIYMADKKYSNNVFHSNKKNDLLRFSFRRRRSIFMKPLDDAKTCTSDKECSGDHKVCASGQCVCARGYYALDGSPTCLPELYTACSEDTDCQMKKSTCRTEPGGKMGHCSCQAGYVASADNRICRKMSRAIGWSCLHDEQCGYFGPGAICNRKKCRCSEQTHYVSQENYCWVSRGLGEDCQGSEDCTDGDGGATCVGGKCQCLPGHHPTKNGTQCRPDAIGVGSSCTEDSDCVSEHTRCGDDKLCTCKAGYLAVDNTCQTGIGGPCSASTDCHVTASICQTGNCTCQDGYVPSAAFNRCLPVSTDACEEDVQCASTAGQCLKGTCSCRDGEHFREGRCWEKRALGERCTRSTECYFPSSPERVECRNGVCQCRFEYLIPGSSRMCAEMSSASVPKISWMGLVVWVSYTYVTVRL